MGLGFKDSMNLEFWDDMFRVWECMGLSRNTIMWKQMGICLER